MHAEVPYRSMDQYASLRTKLRPEYWFAPHPRQSLVHHRLHRSLTLARLRWNMIGSALDLGSGALAQ